jgi:hypothetical protein
MIDPDPYPDPQHWRELSNLYLFITSCVRLRGIQEVDPHLHLIKIRIRLKKNQDPDQHQGYADPNIVSYRENLATCIY